MVINIRQDGSVTDDMGVVTVTREEAGRLYALIEQMKGVREDEKQNFESERSHQRGGLPAVGLRS
jgi:hypothetical protein